MKKLHPPLPPPPPKKKESPSSFPATPLKIEILPIPHPPFKRYVYQEGWLLDDDDDDA